MRLVNHLMLPNVNHFAWLGNIYYKLALTFVHSQKCGCSMEARKISLKIRKCGQFSSLTAVVMIQFNFNFIYNYQLFWLHQAHVGLFIICSGFIKRMRLLFIFLLHQAIFSVFSYYLYVHITSSSFSLVLAVFLEYFLGFGFLWFVLLVFFSRISCCSVPVSQWKSHAPSSLRVTFLNHMNISQFAALRPVPISIGIVIPILFQIDISKTITHLPPKKNGSLLFIYVYHEIQ